MEISVVPKNEPLVSVVSFLGRRRFRQDVRETSRQSDLMPMIGFLLEINGGAFEAGILNEI
jgi:nitrate reductase gamma subunit